MTPPAAAAAPTVRPRRAPAPRGPRRISGPARPATAPRRPAAGAAANQAGLVLGLLSALESLAQHRLLDRLIRGRVWIGLVAFALIGIVTLQLGLLKLNGGIGRALEHEALLQRENAALSIENSELAAGTRVEQSAAKLGMAFVPAGALRFLVSGRSRRCRQGRGGACERRPCGGPGARSERRRSCIVELGRSERRRSFERNGGRVGRLRRRNLRRERLLGSIRRSELERRIERIQRVERSLERRIGARSGERRIERNRTFGRERRELLGRLSRWRSSSAGSGGSSGCSSSS